MLDSPRAPAGQTYPGFGWDMGARGILAFPVPSRHAGRAAERPSFAYPGFGWDAGARGIFLAFPVRQRHAELVAGARFCV